MLPRRLAPLFEPFCPRLSVRTNAPARSTTSPVMAAAARRPLGNPLAGRGTGAIGCTATGTACNCGGSQAVPALAQWNGSADAGGQAKAAGTVYPHADDGGGMAAAPAASCGGAGAIV